jgi:hypothetical protein
MSLAWDEVSGHGLLVGAEAVLLSLALRPPKTAGEPFCSTDDSRNVRASSASSPASAVADVSNCNSDGTRLDTWRLEVVRRRDVTNPGLGIVRQESQLMNY